MRMAIVGAAAAAAVGGALAVTPLTVSTPTRMPTGTCSVGQQCQRLESVLMPAPQGTPGALPAGPPLAPAPPAPAAPGSPGAPAPMGQVVPGVAGGSGGTMPAAATPGYGSPSYGSPSGGGVPGASSPGVVPGDDSLPGGDYTPFDPAAALGDIPGVSDLSNAASGAAALYSVPYAANAAYSVLGGLVGLGGSAIGLASGAASTVIAISYAYQILNQSGLLGALNSGFNNAASMLLPAAGATPGLAMAVPALAASLPAMSEANLPMLANLQALAPNLPALMGNLQAFGPNLPALMNNLPLLGAVLPALGMPGVPPEALPLVAALASQALPIGIPGLPTDPAAIAAALPALQAALPALAAGVPGLPGLPGLPAGLPGLPGLPALPGGLPALPGLPGGLPALPAGLPLPALPQGLPALPALPPLPPNPIPQKVCVGGFGPIGFCTP
jgi:hypothetical protein